MFMKVPCTMTVKGTLSGAFPEGPVGVPYGGPTRLRWLVLDMASATTGDSGSGGSTL